MNQDRYWSPGGRWALKTAAAIYERFASRIRDALAVKQIEYIGRPPTYGIYPPAICLRRKSCPYGIIEKLELTASAAAPTERYMVLVHSGRALIVRSVLKDSEGGLVARRAERGKIWLAIDDLGTRSWYVRSAEPVGISYRLAEHLQ